MSSSSKRIKQLNFGYLLEQEASIKELTEESYKRPLRVLDDATKFFMDTLDFALKTHESTDDKILKDYCRFYLTQGNAILHMIRTSRLDLVYGYYGSIAILTRTFINYLNMAIYIHHHPEDVNLLLKESREDFKNNPEYKKKFHEYNLKKELEGLGYKEFTSMPDDFAKVTHGSLWGSQVFGYKDIKDKEGDYDLTYSPKFSNLQASQYLSLILVWPLDFATYFMIHLKPIKLKNFKRLEVSYQEINDQVSFAIKAIERAYQFIKNVPEEMQEAILRRLEDN